MTAARRKNMTEFYVLSQDAKTLGFSIGQQKRLLKDISISNTSLDWQTILSGLISSQSAADIQGIPLTLSVVNNSDIVS
mgnify:CR=1 FL=1